MAAEGVEGTVSDNGPLSSYVCHLIQCLKQSMQKAGARSIDELHRKATFIVVSHASQVEDGVHDLISFEKPDFREETLQISREGVKGQGSSGACGA